MKGEKRVLLVFRVAKSFPVSLAGCFIQVMPPFSLSLTLSLFLWVSLFAPRLPLLFDILSPFSSWWSSLPNLDDDRDCEWATVRCWEKEEEGKMKCEAIALSFFAPFGGGVAGSRGDSNSLVVWCYYCWCFLFDFLPILFFPFPDQDFSPFVSPSLDPNLFSLHLSALFLLSSSSSSSHRPHLPRFFYHLQNTIIPKRKKSKEKLLLIIPKHLLVLSVSASSALVCLLFPVEKDCASLQTKIWCVSCYHPFSSFFLSFTSQINTCLPFPMHSHDWMETERLWKCERDSRECLLLAPSLNALRTHFFLLPIKDRRKEEEGERTVRVHERWWGDVLK